jgi:DNA-binding IclR family transcriptional regulator
MSVKTRRPIPVRAVSRAVGILTAFTEDAAQQGLTLSEMSRRLGIPVATVYRLVAELEQAGLLQRHPVTDLYVLGPMVVWLGRLALNQAGLGDAARAVMVELQAEVREGVTMAVRQGAQAMYIHQVQSSHVLRADLKVGSLVPLHCTAVGKVLLAGCQPEKVAALVQEAGLARYTPNTITSLPYLQAELALTRMRGYSIDNEEFLPGVRCIGVPILDAHGGVVAAMAVTGPAQRMTNEALERIRPRLQAAAERVSRLLGYMGYSHKGWGQGGEQSA